MKTLVLVSVLLAGLALPAPALAQRDRLGLGEALAPQVIRSSATPAVEATVARVPTSPCAPAAPVVDQVQMLEAVQSKRR